MWHRPISFLVVMVALAAGACGSKPPAPPITPPAPKPGPAPEGQPPTTDPKTSQVTIFGHVRGTDGQPLAGAVVALVPPDSLTEIPVRLVDDGTRVSIYVPGPDGVFLRDVRVVVARGDRASGRSASAGRANPASAQ